MKTINVQLNELECEQRPTTQEDNFGQIIDRWDLFKNNCFVGNLVKYSYGAYAAFHKINNIIVRYDLSKNEVTFN